MTTQEDREGAIEKLEAEIARLQRVIDSRPAINAGLPESYIKWSQSIYVMEHHRAAQAIEAGEHLAN